MSGMWGADIGVYRDGRILSVITEGKSALLQKGAGKVKKIDGYMQPVIDDV